MKKVVLLLCMILFLTGCGTDDNKFYLDEKYYGLSEFILVDENKVRELQENEASYVLFTYNSYCTFQVPCDDIFLEYMKTNDIAFNSIAYEDFSKTEFINTVLYAPSIILVKDGKIVDYLDAEDDSDLDKYQDVEAFSNWINQYINLK